MLKAKRSTAVAQQQSYLYCTSLSGEPTRIPYNELYDRDLNAEIYISFPCPLAKEHCINCPNVINRLAGQTCVLEGVDKLLEIIKPFDRIILTCPLDGSRTVTMEADNTQIEFQCIRQLVFRHEFRYKLLVISLVQDTRVDAIAVKTTGATVLLGHEFRTTFNDPFLFIVSSSRKGTNIYSSAFEWQRDKKLKKALQTKTLQPFTIDTVVDSDNGTIHMSVKNTPHVVVSRILKRTLRSIRIDFVKDLQQNTVLARLHTTSPLDNSPFTAAEDIMLPIEIKTFFITFKN